MVVFDPATCHLESQFIANRRRCRALIFSWRSITGLSTPGEGLRGRWAGGLGGAVASQPGVPLSFPVASPDPGRASKSLVAGGERQHAPESSGGPRSASPGMLGVRIPGQIRIPPCADARPRSQESAAANSGERERESEREGEREKEKKYSQLNLSLMERAYNCN